jgi:hypothetical protein
MQEQLWLRLQSSSSFYYQVYYPKIMMSQLMSLDFMNASHRSVHDDPSIDGSRLDIVWKQ